jgi:hypothetical protein
MANDAINCNKVVVISIILQWVWEGIIIWEEIIIWVVIIWEILITLVIMDHLWDNVDSAINAINFSWALVHIYILKIKEMGLERYKIIKADNNMKEIGNLHIIIKLIFTMIMIIIQKVININLILIKIKIKTQVIKFKMLFAKIFN